MHVCGNCYYNPQKKRAGWPTKKKKTKVIHLSEAVSLPNELYFYEGKHSDSNTCFIMVHYIHARKRHAVQLFVTESFKGNAVIK